MSGEKTRLPGACRAVALTAVIAATGCAPAPPPTPEPVSRGSIAASRSADPSGTAAPGTPERPALLLAHGVVPQSHASLFVATDGESIVYSAMDPGESEELAPDLYRMVPGRAPELLFRNPRRDSNLIPVAVAGQYVAFGEGNVDALGEKGWVLWLLGPGLAEPFELDRNPPTNEAPLPLVAVSADHVVWQAIGFGPDLERADLKSVSLPDLERRVLATADPQDFQWWDPHLDGDRLVYTEVDYVNGDPSSPTKPAELYAMLLDLADPGARPTRLDASGRATEPALLDDIAVWKEADNVFTWGSLTIHDLATGSSRMASVSPQSGIQSPSIGNRFLGFWGIDDTEFVLYDLKTDAVAEVFVIDPASDIGGAFRVEVAGDLVVWVQGTESGSVIAWGRLPTMDDP